MGFDAEPFDRVWNQQIGARIASLPATKQRLWKELFILADETGSRSTPTQRWAKQIAALVDAIGRELYCDTLRSCLDQAQHIDEPLLGARTVTLRALMWASRGYADVQMIASYGALAVHCFDKIREYGQRSTLLGNACLWVLSTTEPDEAVGELFRLRNTVLYPSTQKLIEKALDRVARRRRTDVSTLRRTLAASTHELSLQNAARDLRTLSDTDQATALLARLYEDPSDDQLRQVYADSLLAVQDPLGEFIMLQYLQQPNRRQKARERALLKKHRDTWLGELAPVLRKSDLEFKRGFAVAGRLISSCKKPILSRSHGCPRWLTFEQLDLDGAQGVTVDFVVDPVMRRLRTLCGLPTHLVEPVLTNAGCPPLETLGISGWGDGQSIERSLQAATLPNLRHLDFVSFWPYHERSLALIYRMCQPVMENLDSISATCMDQNDVDALQTVLSWQPAPRVIRLAGAGVIYTITRNGNQRMLAAELEHSQWSPPSLRPLIHTLNSFAPGTFTGLRIVWHKPTVADHKRALDTAVERLMPLDPLEIQVPEPS